MGCKIRHAIHTVTSGIPTMNHNPVIKRIGRRWMRKWSFWCLLGCLLVLLFLTVAPQASDHRWFRATRLSLYFMSLLYSSWTIYEQSVALNPKIHVEIKSTIRRISIIRKLEGKNILKAPMFLISARCPSARRDLRGEGKQLTMYDYTQLNKEDTWKCLPIREQSLFCNVIDYWIKWMDGLMILLALLLLFEMVDKETEATQLLPE